MFAEGVEKKFMLNNKLKKFEEKRIKIFPFDDPKAILMENREWLLGGVEFQWEYSRDLITQELVLRRW